MNKWVKFLRPYGVAVVCGLLMAMAWPLSEVTHIVEASPIKNWNSNEYIRYSDLNNVVNHLHANLGHGHGAIITANDISSNAAIRPEQTTFGSTINRALVFAGTFGLNPDGGNAYVPINGTGTLAVTVSKTSISSDGGTWSVVINGAAQSGLNLDSGVHVYTVMYRPVTFTSYASIFCTDQGGGTGSAGFTSSPIGFGVDCWDVTLLATPYAAAVGPTGMAVEVYNNMVQ